MSNFKDWVYPDCHLCRGLRAAMSAGTAIVLAFYAWQLIRINIEMNVKEKVHGREL
jgi:hypothetical protein